MSLVLSPLISRTGKMSAWFSKRKRDSPPSIGV
jgi:hypothetical protein